MSDHLPRRVTLTSILATVGTPGTASASMEVLERLVESGATLFRLNFSHGDLEEHRETLRLIREVEARVGKPIGVLGDLSGPKLRVGPVATVEGIEVEAGQDVIFARSASPDATLRTPPIFTSNYAGLVDDVEVGHRLLVNDGAVRMLVIAKARDSLTCRVMIGETINADKGINLPNTSLNVDSITEKDWRCLEWAIEQDLDFIALSFVRRADEIRALKVRIEQLGAGHDDRRLPVIAKIEKPEALDNIEEILDTADGVMVARGDLGVEMDLAEVPVIQKRLVALAGQFGKPCIVATQMLESMIERATPTRAEASDVANAIFEGADCVMLSGETAVGRYPGVAVDTMARIIECTEDYLQKHPPIARRPERLTNQGHWTVALAHGASTIADDVGARLIATYSNTGVTALHLSQYRFRVPILAFSDDVSALRRMNLLFGVIPAHINEPRGLDEFTQRVDEWLLETQLLEPGAPIILIAGHPISSPGSTNSLAVHHVGDPATGYRGR